MLRVSTDSLERLRSYREQDVVDHRFILKGDITDRCWQCEHDVKVLNGQQFILPSFKPALGCTGLTLRAVTVAA